VGIIGLGQMGYLHMMNCFHIDNIKVVSVADRSKRALKKAEALGVKNIYTDYRDLLNSSNVLDAAIISLPNFLHLDSIQMALEAGLDVFVEKPMAKNVSEGQRIVELVEKSGNIFMVGHCMRFLDAVEKMKKSVEKGSIGKIEEITLEEIISGPFSQGKNPKPVPEWRLDLEKAGGGVLLDIGYHLIDLFRFFIGEGKLVYSRLDYKFNFPIEDEAIVILSSPVSSTKGIINVGYYQKTSFPEYNFRVILQGNAGFISSENMVPKNLYLYAIKEGIKNFTRRMIGKKIKPLSYTYYYEMYHKELEYFFECIRRDIEPSVSAIDGLETIKIIEESYNFSKKCEA